MSEEEKEIKERMKKYRNILDALFEGEDSLVAVNTLAAFLTSTIVNISGENSPRFFELLHKNMLLTYEKVLEETQKKDAP